MRGVEASYEQRPTRICMACGQRDKAPRDQVALPDGNTALYHKDCHAMLGCKVCQEELDAVAGGSGQDGKKNEDLWRAIVDGMETEETVYTRDDVTGEYKKALDDGRMVDKDWKGDK